MHIIEIQSPDYLYRRVIHRRINVSKHHGGTETRHAGSGATTITCLGQPVPPNRIGDNLVRKTASSSARRFSFDVFG